MSDPDELAAGRSAHGGGELARVLLADGRYAVRKRFASAAQPEFRAEVGALLAVTAPEITRLLDAGIAEDGRAWLLREWIEGESLRDALSAATPLLEATRTRVLTDVLAGLAALHRAGLIHADLKPENVLLDAAGGAKLCDFGLATATALHGALAAGSSYYLPPERLLGWPLDPRADLFSFGLLLYELLGGELPRDPAAFYARFPREPLLPLLPSDLAGRGIAPALIALIERLTAIDPWQRPADVQETEALLVATGLLPRGATVRARPRLRRDFFLAPAIEQADLLLAADAPSRRLFVLPRAEDGKAFERAAALAAAIRGVPRAAPAAQRRNGRQVEIAEATAATLADAGARIAGGAPLQLLLWSARPAAELGTLPPWLAVAPFAPPDPARLAAQLAGTAAQRDALPLPLLRLAEALLEALGPDPAAIDATLDLLVAEGRLDACGDGVQAPPLATRWEALPRPAATAPRLEAPLVALAHALELAGEPLREPLWRSLAQAHGLAPATARAALEAEALLVAGPDGLARLAGRLPSPTASEREAAGRALLAAAQEGEASPRLRLVAALAAGALREAAALLVASERELADGRVDALLPELEPLLLDAACDGAVRHAVGELLLAGGRGARAAELFASVAADPAAPLEQQLRALRRAGDTALLRGDFDAARRAFEEGAARAKGRPEEHGFVRGLADATLRGGDAAGALALLEPLFPRGAAPTRERLEMEPLRALALLRHGDLAAAEEVLKRAIAATRPLGHPALLAVLLTNLSLAQWRSGRPLIAIETAREALSIQEERGQAHEIAALHLNLGTILLDLLRFDAARHHFEAALELRRALGEPRGIALARAGLALVAVEQGQLAEAAAGFAAARPVLAALGQPREQLRCELGDWKARFRSGQWRGLTRGLRDLVARCEAGRHLDVAIEAAQLLFERHLASGGNESLERAAEAFARLERLVGASREAAATTALQLRRAQLKRAVGDGDGAQSVLASALPRLAGTPLALDGLLEEVVLHGPPPESGRIEAAERAARVANHRRGLVAALAFRRAWHVARGDRHGAAATLRALQDVLRDATGSDAPRTQLRAALGMMAPRGAAVRLAASGRTDTREEMTAHLQLLRTFLAINKRLAGEADVARLLDYLVETALSLTGAERGFIALERDGATRFEVGKSARGGDLGAPEKELSFSFLRQCLEKGRTLVTSNAGLDPRFREQASVSALDLRSIVCVPIRVDDESQAALYVDHPVREGAFGEREIELCEALADQAGIALRNLHARQRIEALNGKLATRVEVQQSALAIATRRLDRAGEEPVADGADSRWIGDSEAFRAAGRLLERYAQTDLSVLVRGESGTGKERAARRLHDLSPRKERPFVSESCTAVPETLLEAEFFGVRKGAFTGADADRPGLFELARGGTLFLDEIGEMPLALQAKLLRALEERAVRPLGAREPVAVDLRLVTATNRDLRTLAREGKFREDLYFRIAAAELELPPLRARKGDVVPLAQSFLEQLNREHGTQRRFTRAALGELDRYAWPGNIRQLKNEVQRAFAIADGDDLDWHAPSGGVERPPGGLAFPEPLPTLAELEKLAIREALVRHDGDKEAAARAIGISRASIYDKVRRYDLGPASGRKGAKEQG
ncbi:MAG: sigma 54-interacting transcriptional regulator [Planctomycetes bacterium]|nr:sigma 54-interacting transcriptional regulator [Planctomycetota bacterium]